jgi:hypothetical protein
MKKYVCGGGIPIKEDIKGTEDNILNYLYENRFESPQSLTKIRLALNFGDGRGDIRLLKSCLQFLVEKNFIKKQEIRGNYKIEDKGIMHIEEDQNKRV